MGVLAFVTSGFLGSKFRNELIEKQGKELAKKLHEEGINIRENQQNEDVPDFSDKKLVVSFPFYDISPIFSFISLVLLAPIVEECVFRYLIFEIFGKKNLLAYIFSGTGFIFFHWMGPICGGLLTFTTIKLLLITYLPMTIFFIYAYRKSKWNIIYPIWFHFLWNLLIFGIAVGRS